MNPDDVQVTYQDDEDGRWAVAQVPDHEGWTVKVHYVSQGGTAIAPQEIRLAYSGGSADFAATDALTTRLIRHVPLDAITRKAREDATRAAHSGEDSLPEGWLEVLRDYKWGNRGRPRQISEYELAVLGRAVEEKAGSASPNVEIAAELDIQRVQVRDRLQRAKDLGLYRPNGHGKTGGTLTTKGRAVLKAGPLKRQGKEG